MATAQVNKINRPVRKIEKPRLNFQRNTNAEEQNHTVEEIFMYIDEVVHLLELSNIDAESVHFLCNHLKANSALLESNYKDELDKAFVAIRNGSQDEKLDIITRVHLLEIVELRAKQWQQYESVDPFYQQKINELMNADTSTGSNSNVLAPSASPPLLGPGDVLKNSGKFSKPTRIPGKNYCKDEVVIKNSDSGKVNPGAKERLVQITGTTEDKINLAKGFIKDTIQRNASPVRMEQAGDISGAGGSSSSLNSGTSDESNRFLQTSSNTITSPLAHPLSPHPSTRDEVGKFIYTVKVGDQHIKICGNDHELIKTAKLALDSYFERDYQRNTRKTSFSSPQEFTGFKPPTLSRSMSMKSDFADMQISEAPEISPQGFPGFKPPTLSRSMSMKSDVADLQISEAPENGKLMEDVAEESTSRSSKPETNGEIIEKNLSPEVIKMSYDFLLACSKGPLAKRLPADWERIKREVPAIIPTKAPIRWFEPDAYKAKVASAGFLTVLTTGESENDPE